MKRQNIRKMSLLISFLLFPITLYYLSPYIIVQGAIEGVVTGSFIVFAAMFILSLFFGRIFCSWLCPAGGLGECCMMVSDKKAKGGRFNIIKFLIWFPWITSIILIFIFKSKAANLDFFYMTEHGISVSAPQVYIIYYFVIILIVILSLTSGRRGFCHYVCWMAPFMIIGSKIKNKLGYPSLHLAAEKEKCVDCKLCSKKCPMSLEVNEMVKINNMSNSECILCGECIDVCPKKVIKYKFK